jgi:mono/diheme cytochrome c family protein
MKLNKILSTLILFGALTMSISSCVSEGNDPGIEYAPQMYVSTGYEPYSQTGESEYNPNGMTMRLPVNGTVARGQLIHIYPHANNAEGYAASAAYTTDLPATEENLAEGKRLYDYACWHCHGKSGKNDGPIFKSGKMPGPAWASVEADYIRNIPMGQMYHSITYGRNLMGAHAHILSPEERWKVIYYIKSMSLGDEFAVTSSEEEAEVEEEVAVEEEVVVESSETHAEH